MPTLFITGASRGLGLEFARQYAAAGWHVIATCREPANASELAALGGNVRFEALDVNDFGAIDGLAGKLSGVPIDILINNAGIGGPRQGPMDMDEQGFLAVLHTNTLAPLKVAKIVPLPTASRPSLPGRRPSHL